MVLPKIDSLSVTVLRDNYTDRLLPTVYPSIRPPLIKNEQFLPLPAPVAEHGFSTFIRARCHDKNNKENVVLFDCGTSENGVIHNADILGIDFNSIQSIVLSHGHFDHFTGLLYILERIDKPMRMICHPDAFLKRWIVFPNGKDKAKLPFLNIDELERQKLNIIFKKGPSLLSKDNIEDYKDTLDHETDYSVPTLLITGQIPRHTAYEKGFPLQYKEDPTKGNLIHDPLVNDYQAIIANVKDKGLIIISGCAHAGIINTINYAKLITGVNKIFAIVGGFHLTGGGIYEDAIEPTMKELKTINPNYLVPCHCTGWKATNRIIQELPDKFLQPSTCTTFTFDSTTN